MLSFGFQPRILSSTYLIDSRFWQSSRENEERTPVTKGV